MKRDPRVVSLEVRPPAYLVAFSLPVYFNSVQILVNAISVLLELIFMIGRSYKLFQPIALTFLYWTKRGCDKERGIHAGLYGHYQRCLLTAN